MSKRLRVSGYRVVPEAFVDDGETLEPLQVQPVYVPIRDWPRVVELSAAALAKLQAQVDEGG